MSSDETDLVERLHAVAERFDMPPAPLADDLWRGRRRVRRNRVLVAGVAAAVVAVVIGITAAVAGHDRAQSDRPEPVKPPGLVVGDVPVWYDAQGLHRGDVVEQTPVDIGQRDGDRMQGALALVRTGAVYLDPATGDVWFHPWGGQPRIVGHNSEAGPGGDPNGDTAVWFEGSSNSVDAEPVNPPGELVVYDTAAGRETSRTEESEGASGGFGGDHTAASNSFRQVSAERVVWSGGRTLFSHDVRTQKTSEVEVAKDFYSVLDVHDEIEILSEGLSRPWVMSVPGQAEQFYPELLGSRGRLSPSGNYALAIGFDSAAIVDTRTGELWPVPRSGYASNAWSYGDIALVDLEDALIACDAARRECERLPAERPFLMPTN